MSFYLPPKNRLELLGPKLGLTANTYIAAIQAYNLANPNSTIDTTRINREEFGWTHSTYRRQWAHHLEGKIRIIDTVRGLALYDKIFFDLKFYVSPLDTDQNIVIWIPNYN